MDGREILEGERELGKKRLEFLEALNRSEQEELKLIEVRWRLIRTENDALAEGLDRARMSDDEFLLEYAEWANATKRMLEGLYSHMNNIRARLDNPRHETSRRRLRSLLADLNFKLNGRQGERA